MPGSSNNSSGNAPQIPQACLDRLTNRMNREKTKAPNEDGSISNPTINIDDPAADNPALDDHGAAYEAHLRNQIEQDRLKRLREQQEQPEDVDLMAEQLLRALQLSNSEHPNSIPELNACTNCGYDVPRMDNFCGNCGTRNCWQCSSCSRANEYCHAFCGTCGTAQRLRSPTSSVSGPLPDNAQHYSATNLDARSEDGYSFADQDDDEDVEEAVRMPDNAQHLKSNLDARSTDGYSFADDDESAVRMPDKAQHLKSNLDARSTDGYSFADDDDEEEDDASAVQMPDKAQHFKSSMDARSVDGCSFADDDDDDEPATTTTRNHNGAWMCPTCTYCNENPLFLTCEICSEPRPALENVSAPSPKPQPVAPAAAVDDELAEIYAHQERLLAEYQGR